MQLHTTLLLALLTLSCKSKSLDLFAKHGSGEGTAALPAASMHTAKAPGDLPGAPVLRAPFDVAWDTMRLEDGIVRANVRGGGTADLSVDPDLQKFSERALAAAKLKSGAAVALDVRTGRVLAFASFPLGATHQAQLAGAPAASVFKVVTGTALIESRKVTPATEECFGGGGGQKLTERDLAVDPDRDHTCVTLAHAMGHSTNAVFARLAARFVPRDKLQGVSDRLHFTNELGLDVPLQPSKYAPPADDAGYARTAAGFWNTTLSAPHAAWISAVMAGQGRAPRPWLVARAQREGSEPYLHAEPAAGAAVEQVVSPEVASAVTEMMRTTVTDGTARKAFRDGAGRSFVGDVAVAGKTGTLTDHENKVYYTWFTSFAPAAASPGPGSGPGFGPAVEPIAIAVVAANGPSWKVKANVIAREIMRHAFAQRRVPGVLSSAVPAYETPEPKKRSKSTATAKKH